MRYSAERIGSYVMSQEMPTKPSGTVPVFRVPEENGTVPFSANGFTTASSQDVDALTGALSRAQLEFDLSTELLHAGRSGQHYINSFLCLDIENFQAYLDHHGFGESRVLVALADRLRSQYPDHKLYRFGGRGLSPFA